MIEFSNGLTKAREEMLELTKEECAELIKACTKIWRYGITLTNQDSLEEEIADVIACVAVLSHNKVIDIDRVNIIVRQKLDWIKDPAQKRVHFITPEMVP